MRHLFDKTTKRLKKKAGKPIDLLVLQPPLQQGRSTSLAPLQQAEDPTGLAGERVPQRPETTMIAAGTQLPTVFISVATDASQHVESAATKRAPPPTNAVKPATPAYAEAPSPPTILATTGSALKGLLVAARDGSDLFLPLKAALVGVVALWDIFDASLPFCFHTDSEPDCSAQPRPRPSSRNLRVNSVPLTPSLQYIKIRSIRTCEPASQ